MLHIHRADLFSLSVDAIVNAANKKLLPGGGIDGLMSKHCGPRLQDAKNAIVVGLPKRELNTSEAVLTDAFDHTLTKYVIHTAAPQISSHCQPRRLDERELRLCYYNCLVLANERKCESVAFPVLGAGIYHWPIKMATAVAIQSICAFFEVNQPKTTLKTVFLCTLSGGIFEECLNNSARQSTIDCSTNKKAYEARSIVERNASNVKMSLSSDVDVKYFVEKWSTHAEVVKATRMNALMKKKRDRAISPAQSFRSSTFWETMTSCFKKPRKAPSKVAISKTQQRPRRSTELGRLNRHFNTNDEQREASRKKRRKSAKDIQREERQKNENERIESLLGSENVRRAMLKSVSRPETEKKANTLIVMENVPEMVAALREPYFGYITKFLGEESISTLEVDLFFKMLQDILRCEHLLKVIEGFLAKIKEHIRSILTQRVICPDKSDLQLKKLRQLLRMRYHVWDETQSSEGFQTMNNLYPILWREFVGEKTTEQEDQDGKVVNDIGLRLEIPEIEQVDEDRLPAGDASQQQVVPEEIVELPDDFDAEKLDIEKDDVDLALDVAVADLNPEVELNMEALRILRSLTHIKRCSQNCEEPSKKHAALVYDRLMMFAKSSDCDIGRLLDDGIVENFILDNQLCYAGARSMEKRLKNLRILYSLREKLKECLEKGSHKLIHEALSMRDAPSYVRMEFARTFKTHQDTSRHTQFMAEHRCDFVRKRFLERMTVQETEVCELCNQITASNDMAKRNLETLHHALSERQKEVFQTRTQLNVCRSCTRVMPHQRKIMPAHCEANGLLCEETPEELQGLNWLELVLIQRYRPIQKIVELRDIGGRKTGVKATTGVMIVVPVPLESTISHVANTLPSDSHLQLFVTTRFGAEKIVRLPRVLKALNWLKQNNHFYKDIEINQQFSFDGDRVSFAKDVVNKDLNVLLSSDDGHLLTQENTEFQIVRHVNPPPVEGFAIDNYRLRSHLYMPISSDDNEVEPNAFPHLFPSGHYHLGDEREIKLNLSKYIHHQLRQANPKFCLDPNYLAFQYAKRMQTDLFNNMGTQARISRNTTKQDLMGILNDERFSASMNSMFEEMRGFGPYWNKRKLELRAHIEAFGSPTWFVTLNPAEQHWKDVLQIYQRFYPETTSENIREAIAKDSSHWCRYFRRRMNAFFSEVLFNDNGPLGKVLHYFWRIEYQHRGTQHIHCVLWTADRPSPDASPQEIAEFLDKYVTARMPDEKTETELYNIIKEHQLHWKRHSKTCLRTKKRRGRITQTCRFEFPRPVLGHTVVAGVSKNLAGLPGVSRKQYHLMRRECDTMVNDYNAELSLIWQANTDVQFIMGGITEVTDYVTGYASKAEKARGTCLFDMKPEDMNNKTMFKTMIDLLRQKETGTLEMHDIFAGHNLFGFNSGHEFVNINEDAKRNRQLRPADQLKVNTQMPAYVDNLVDTYYPNRPEALENFSLMTIALNFEVVAKSEAMKKGLNAVFLTSDELLEQLQQPKINANRGQSVYYGFKEVSDPLSPWFCFPSISTGTCISFEYGHEGTNVKYLKYFRKKKQQVLRTFLPDIIGDVGSVRDFFRRVLMLFSPWREEPPVFSTSEEALASYDKFIDTLKAKSEGAADDITSYIAKIKDGKRESREKREKWARLRKAIQEANCQQFDDEDEEDGELKEKGKVPVRTVDDESFERNLKSMSDEQLQIYDEIIGGIREQVSSQKDVFKRKQILKFVSGTAGTGKSFLINMLADKLTRDYTKEDSAAIHPAVLIIAPTGLAALNIKGNTIHSLFKIEVQRGKALEFKVAQFDDTGETRELFRRVKLIIIDEISMCANWMLIKIHLRLQSIKGNQEVFGGVNIIALGDLMQLRPVNAGRVFEVVSSRQVAEIFGSIGPPLTLWWLFSYSELTTNMRQKKDKSFGEIMSRMRIEQLTADDVTMIKTRLINAIERGYEEPCTIEEAAEYYLKLLEKDPTAMALMPTNNDVIQFNDAVVEKLGMKTIVIVAEDVEEKSAIEGVLEGESGADRQRRERIYQKKEFSIIEKTSRKATTLKPKMDEKDPMGKNTGGLVAKLILAKNARVMLRRNLDVAQGLVNGSQGYLRTIYEKGQSKEVVALGVVFDGKNVETKITKVTAVFNVSGQERRRRTQFPLMIAYAATIHKSQGMTLKNAVISTRSMFCAGQAFVAFSRVRSLDGLHLMDFFSQKVYCDDEALKETNRLRLSVNLPVFEMPVRAAKKPTKLPPITALRKRKDVPDLVIRVGSPGNSPQKKLAKNSTAQIQREQKMAEGLTLFNESGTDCFVNSVVNLLHCSKQLTDKIVEMEIEAAADRDASIADDTEEPLLVSLKDILVRHTTSVARLRTKLHPDRRNHTGDVKEAYMDIFTLLPEQIQDLFRFTITTSVSCEGCRSNQAIVVTQRVVDRIEMFFYGGSLEEEFQRHIESLSPACACGRQPSVSCEIRIPSDSKYVVFNLNMNVNNPPCWREANRALLDFYGNRLELRGAIQFIPGGQGHYICWKRLSNDNFLKLNDRHISLERKIPNEGRNFVMILYERHQAVPAIPNVPEEMEVVELE